MGAADIAENGGTSAFRKPGIAKPREKKDYNGFVAGVFSGIAKLIAVAVKFENLVCYWGSNGAILLCSVFYTVGHPFDTIKVRLQTTKPSHFKGPLDCLLQTVGKEGIRALYKGASPPLMGWMVMDSVMLGSLTLYRRLLFEHVFANQQIRRLIPFASKEGPDRLPTLGHSLAGVMAGSTVSFIAAPVEHVKARLQVQYAADKRNRLYSGPIDCATKI
ncbi:hypothetical protein ACO22_07501, partial [Paracoccidioides brasiliensis]